MFAFLASAMGTQPSISRDARIWRPVITWFSPSVAGQTSYDHEGGECRVTEQPCFDEFEDHGHLTRPAAATKDAVFPVRTSGRGLTRASSGHLPDR